MDVQRREKILRDLVKYSCKDVNGDYEQLTEREKNILSKEEFDALLEWADEE